MHRLAAGLLLYFGFLTAFRGFMAFLPVELEDAGYLDWQTGLLVGVFQIVPLVVTTPLGVLSDRVSSRLLTVAGLLIFIGTLALAAWLDSFGLLFVTFLAAGTGGSIVRLNSQATYYRLVGERSRGMKLGLFNAAGVIAFGVGSLAAGYIRSNMDSFSPMLFGALLALPLLPAVFFFSGDTPREKSDVKSYTVDLTDRHIIVFLVIGALYAVHFGVELKSFSLLVVKDMGLSGPTLGWVNMGTSLMMAVSMFLSGRMTDRLKRLNRVAIAGILFSSCANALMMFVSSVTALMSVRVLHIVGDGLFWMFTSVVLSRRFESKKMGGTLGFWAMTAGTASFAGSVISSLIPGNRLPFLAAGGLGLAALAILMLSGMQYGEYDKKEHDPHENNDSHAHMTWT